MRDHLDDTDYAILRLLQADGRMTNVDIARQVGITPPPCLRRMRALEESGYIRSYRAHLDERKLGYGVTAFAMVHLDSQSEAELKAFAERIHGLDAVRECWTLSGDMDFMLRIVTRDLAGFQAFVTTLTGMPNVRNVRTAITLNVIKDEAIVPL